MNHIIRDITICKITNEELEDDSKLAVDFFNDLFSKIAFKKFSNTIYMLIDDKIYMEQAYEKGFPYGRLWCRFENYWEYIMDNITLDREGIKYLIKYMVEERIKSGVGIPIEVSSGYFREMNDDLVGIPTLFGDVPDIELEKHLKNITQI